MIQRLAESFSSRRGPWLAGVVGLVLCLPALGHGLIGDDYLWWLVLQRQPPLGLGLPPLLHVYNFVPAGLDREVLKAAGMLTWWADPEVHIALLRPLTAATMVLDHAVAPRAFWWHHLHSLLWYGAAVAAVGWMLRRVGSPAAGGALVAGLAMLAFAVDESHALPAGWIANRHALVALVFCATVLALHVEWRRTGRRAYLLGALAGLALGLAASEAVLGVTAYIGAWQLCGDRGGWRRRLVALTPYAAVVVAWRGIYNHLGFGIVGSGLYVDPLAQPVDFLAALLARWPTMLAAHWLPVPVDGAIILSPQGRGVLTAVCVLLLLPLLWLFAPLLRRSSEARFWAAGMALALVPLCAAFPMARNLFVASIGGAALLALQARHVGLLPGGEPRRDGPPQPGGRVRRRVTAALLLLHLPVAAASLTALVATQSAFGSFFTGGHRTVPDVPDLEEQSLIFVTGQEFPVAYTPICRWVEGRHAPERTALLSPFWSESRVTREDLWTLVIEPAAGFLAVDADRIERHPSAGFAVGEVVGMPDFDAEVRAVTDDGRPREVAFRFLEPLEAPRYRWMRWGPGGAEPFALPAVGETVVLPAQDVTSLIDRW